MNIQCSVHRRLSGFPWRAGQYCHPYSGEDYTFGTPLKAERKWWLAVGLLLCASFLPAHAADTPVTGDWLVSHILSDPEQLNPLTSNDAGASRILESLFEGLLDREPNTLELRPQLATARPHISDDKLTYTFTIRRDAHFQDGKPLTGQDVLFSLKAVKNPWVNAPHRRVYYQSLVQAELVDDYTLRLVTQEPYFLNESVLGQVTVLPRHYYDPEGLLEALSVAELAAMRPGDAATEASPQGTQARRFAEHLTPISRAIRWGVVLINSIVGRPDRKSCCNGIRVTGV